MARYKERRVGVYDTVTAQVVTPRTVLWDEYIAWLAAGNTPDPDDPPPAPTLEQAKAERSAYIRVRWALAEAAGFSWDGKTWASDQRALNRLWPSMVRAATESGAFTLTWSTASGQTVTLSKAQIIAFNNALQSHLTAQHDRAMARLAAIDAAATVEAVNAIDW